MKGTTYTKSSMNIEIKDDRIRITYTLLGVHLGSHWYNPAKMYPQKKRVEMTNQTLDEYYYAFNRYLDWFSELESIIKQKTETKKSDLDDW